jgi:EAL domain-containing protein (putative c-di-GMP-specific phosphodiesterase class I)
MGDLAHALDRDELVLHYQPIIELATSRLVGFETLVRWQHPTRGLLGPGSFLSIAEETGTIIPMGGWILAAALEQLAKWQESVPSLSMSINLAPSQLSYESIVTAVEALLIATGVPPSTVTLELTEDRVLDDETHIRRLRDLRALGVSLHADDFGSGFASYAALQRLPFTGVKIDRSLVNALGTGLEDGSSPQIRSIVEMAHAMGLEVVAEGI